MKVWCFQNCSLLPVVINATHPLAFGINTLAKSASLVEYKSTKQKHSSYTFSKFPSSYLLANFSLS